MLTVVRTLTDPDATAALARSLARLLRPGDVLALSGPLGAGKTTLVRALASELGVPESLVSSPTFVFVNIYPVPSEPSGHLAGGSLVHVDAYRLTSPEDLDALGWDRLFDPVTRLAAGRSAAVVEWPERIAPALPDRLASITIDPVGPDARRLTITLPDAWRHRPGMDLFAERDVTRCRVTREWVQPLSPTYPFASARARDADLFGWFAGKNVAPRPITPDDLPT